MRQRLTARTRSRGIDLDSVGQARLSSTFSMSSIYHQSVCLTQGERRAHRIFIPSQHENSATVVAVALAGWWPLIGWLELYHGTASTLLSQSNLNVAVHPDLSLIR